MSEADTVLLTKDGAIATVMLNRPAAMNALDRSMTEALHTVLIEVEQDKEIRCVVLRGSGDNFMAGGDIRVFAKALGELPAVDQQAAWATSVTEIDNILDLEGGPTWECQRESTAVLELPPLEEPPRLAG